MEYHDDNGKDSLTVNISTKTARKPDLSRRVQSYTTTDCRTCATFWAIYRSAPELIQDNDIQEFHNHLVANHNLKPFEATA